MKYNCRNNTYESEISGEGGKMPEVSVIIPCYNVSDYIEECLDSFVNQTYRDFEVICIDDGSTDDTADIIGAYMETDRRIRLIRQSNQYAGAARNNGMKCARGKYLFFFDGDDFCEKELLDKMVASAEKYDSDIVVCDLHRYDNVTGEYTDTIGYLRMSYVCEFEERGTVSYRDIPDYILMFASSGPQNKIYRKDFIEREGLLFQTSKRDNDEYFVCMSMVLADRISWVPEKLATYRINNPASLQGFGEAGIDMEDIVLTARYLKAGLQEKERYETVKRSFLNQILIRYVGLVEGQRNYSNFVHVYDYVKNIVFSEFGINKMAADDMISRVEEYRQIMAGNAQEYLFWKMKKLQEGNGEQFPFPFRLIKGHHRIAIYGAGNMGRSYYRQLKKHLNYEIAGWYDAKAAALKDLTGLVSLPETIIPGVADKVVIAIEEKKTAMTVKEFLISNGIKEEDIVWSV